MDRPTLRALLHDSLYVIDERLVADAILARALARPPLPKPERVAEAREEEANSASVP